MQLQAIHTEQLKRFIRIPVSPLPEDTDQAEEPVVK